MLPDNKQIPMHALSHALAYAEHMEKARKAMTCILTSRYDTGALDYACHAAKGHLRKAISEISSLQYWSSDDGKKGTEASIAASAAWDAKAISQAKTET